MKAKSIALFAFASASLIIAASASLLSQDQVPPPPVAPEPPVPPANAAQPRPAVDVKPLLEDVRRQVDAAREQAEVAFGAAGDVFTSFVGGDGNFLFRPGGRAARSLVVASSEMDVETLSTAEEDLNIMARILDKALPGREGDKPDRRAMGIVISSPPGAAVRNLYLEGYGAVFFLDVRFPLLPPPTKNEQAKPKEPTSSAWEEARGELYSSRGTRGDNSARIWDSRKGAPLDASEEYNADKVEQLKESLLDALKNATHVRNIRPEEAITLVISGGETTHMEVGKVAPDADPRVTLKPGAKRRTEVYSVNATGYVHYRGGRGTTMIIRAKKSDIDAFAKGEIDLEQFKKRASSRAY